jgi:hypothetical protein
MDYLAPFNVQEVAQVVIVPRLQFKQTLTQCDIFLGLCGL